MGWIPIHWQRSAFKRQNPDQEDVDLCGCPLMQDLAQEESGPLMFWRGE